MECEILSVPISVVMLEPFDKPLGEQGHNSGGAGGGGGDGAREVEGELDLTPYIHMSAPAIPETFSLERAYLLFRSLGARHLTIVDQHNRVKGIVTRKARPAAGL